MRILHVNDFYGLAGGLERYLQALCRELEARGHQNAVAYATPRPDDPDPAIRPRHLITGLAEGAGRLRRQAAIQLRRVLHDEQPDIVMMHQILNPGAVAAILELGPTVRFAHGFKLICPGGRKTWNASRCLCPRPAGLTCQVVAYRERCMPRNPLVGLRVIARTHRLAALHRRMPVIVASEFMRQIFLLNGFAPERVHALPYFVEIPPEPPPMPPTPVVLFGGRLVSVKGVDRLLRALARIPGMPRLLVAGEGPERPRLSRLAQDLGLADRVDFLGWLSPAQVGAVLDRVSVVAVPSLWPEPFGIIGIEAMAHARPVVAFNVGGIREWLRHEETGLVVPADNVQALADALANLLNDPGRAQKMGEMGRRVAIDRFTPDRHVHALVELFARTREEGRPSAAMGRPTP